MAAVDAASPGAPCSGRAYVIANGEPRPVRELVEGECLQADLMGQVHSDVDAVLEVARRKTASLFAWCGWVTGHRELIAALDKVKDGISTLEQTLVVTAGH